MGGADIMGYFIHCSGPVKLRYYTPWDCELLRLPDQRLHTTPARARRSEGAYPNGCSRGLHRSRTITMPCAARELCLLPGTTPQPPDDHGCRARNGTCGEVEGPDPQPVIDKPHMRSLLKQECTRHAFFLKHWQAQSG